MQPEEIYRPPQADLEIYAPDQTQPQTLPPFFQTAPWKMALFAVISAGVYPLYWFHKQWSQRRSHGESVRPFARAIFSVFFAYSLFERLNQYIRRSARAPLQPVSSGRLALGFFALSLLWRLPEMAGLAGALATWPLIVAQRRINELHAALGYDPDVGVRLTYGDVAAVVLGGLFWLLVLQIR